MAASTVSTAVSPTVPPLSFPKTSATTFHRHAERASYDYGTIHSIINEAQLLHVAFASRSPTGNLLDTQASILPMLGTLASYAHQDRRPTSTSIKQDIYLHAHSSSGLVKAIESCTSQSPLRNGGRAPRDDKPKGLPVSISAALVDGYVLALTPFAHSLNYRSAVLRGHATLVVDADERLFALRRITNSLVPGRWGKSRTPPTPEELVATGVIKVVMSEASAKTRAGGPADSKRDREEEWTVGKVWTGVVPVWRTLGAPVPGGYNAVEKVPEYIEEWRHSGNYEGRQYAFQNASADGLVRELTRMTAFWDMCGTDMGGQFALAVALVGIGFLIARWFT